MARRPFRFAVQATNAADAREWRETAHKVEDLGYSTLFVADHYLGPGPAQRAARTPRQDLAPIAAMATAAAVTDTLRIGCRVFCVDYHVPAVLAKEAATLDVLSDGRLELGIGAGCSPYFATITDDANAALDRVAAATRIPVEIARDHPNVLIGSARAVVEALESRRETLGVNYVTIQQSRIDSFAPIAARLSGC